MDFSPVLGRHKRFESLRRFRDPDPTSTGHEAKMPPGDQSSDGWFTGWWFGTWLLLFHTLGMSSSQLTFIFFKGLDIPPASLLTINHRNHRNPPQWPVQFMLVDVAWNHPFWWNLQTSQVDGVEGEGRDALCSVAVASQLESGRRGKGMELLRNPTGFCWAKRWKRPWTIINLGKKSIEIHRNPHVAIVDGKHLTLQWMLYFKRDLTWHIYCGLKHHGVDRRIKILKLNFKYLQNSPRHDPKCHTICCAKMPKVGQNSDIWNAGYRFWKTSQSRTLLPKHWAKRKHSPCPDICFIFRASFLDCRSGKSIDFHKKHNSWWTWVNIFTVMGVCVL